MAEILERYVLERARELSPRTAIDAYAGAGQTASLLSQAGIVVTAIELDPDASEWSSSILRAPSRALQGRVEDLLPGALPADLVILNPPRAGVDERVTQTLEANASHIRSLIYVSCNPATLARDVARLPSYGIENVRAFDMFPQTAHVETVCELRSLSSATAA
jgi:23S rRNA (uracil1939-C5)-methyltransferase